MNFKKRNLKKDSRCNSFLSRLLYHLSKRDYIKPSYFNLLSLVPVELKKRKIETRLFWFLSFFNFKIDQWLRFTNSFSIVFPCEKFDFIFTFKRFLNRFTYDCFTTKYYSNYFNTCRTIIAQVTYQVKLRKAYFLLAQLQEIWTVITQKCHNASVKIPYKLAI